VPGQKLAVPGQKLAVPGRRRGMPPPSYATTSGMFRNKITWTI
jgi:hypothetical protein